MSESNDFSNHILVVGGGITAYYAANFLAKSGFPVILVHMVVGHPGSKEVHLDGISDSTYSSSSGKGGLTKFWEFQLMYPSESAFIERSWVASGNYIRDEDIFRRESAALEREFDLQDFKRFRPKFQKDFRSQIFEGVSSQFLSRHHYRNIFIPVNKANPMVFEGFAVDSFQFDEALNKYEVSIVDSLKQRTLLTCKALVLAAGTIGNAQILNETQKNHKLTLWPTLGTSLYDHSIVDIGVFLPRSILSTRFRIPTYKRNQSLGKVKYQIPFQVQKRFRFPDFAVEITPLPRTASQFKGVRGWVSRVVTSVSNRLFLRTCFDIIPRPRKIRCEILMEHSSLRIARLSFDEDGIAIQHNYLDDELKAQIIGYVDQALAKSGYFPIHPREIRARSAYHLMGSTPMGYDATDSVVDFKGSLHGFKRVKIVGLSNLSTVGFVNPTYSGLVQCRAILKDLIVNLK